MRSSIFSDGSFLVSLCLEIIHAQWLEIKQHHISSEIILHHCVFLSGLLRPCVTKIQAKQQLTLSSWQQHRIFRERIIFGLFATALRSRSTKERNDVFVWGFIPTVWDWTSLSFHCKSTAWIKQNAVRCEYSDARCFCWRSEHHRSRNSGGTRRQMRSLCGLPPRNYPLLVALCCLTD